MKKTTVRTERLVARASIEEKAAVHLAAKESNRDASDYIRLILAIAVKEKTKV